MRAGECNPWQAVTAACLQQLLQHQDTAGKCAATKGQSSNASKLARTVHFLKHLVHLLQVAVVQEPNAGVLLILLKRDCEAAASGSTLGELSAQQACSSVHAVVQWQAKQQCYEEASRWQWQTCSCQLSLHQDGAIVPWYERCSRSWH